LEINTTENGLSAFFKQEYKRKIVRHIWANPGITFKSLTLWQMVNEKSKESISRASVINFCNEMVDQGFFKYSEATGKGGHHRLYLAAYTPEKFVEQVKYEVDFLEDRLRGEWWK
jgi:hypothetical protein